MEKANAGGSAFLRLRQPHFGMDFEITGVDTGVALANRTQKAKARLTHYADSWHLNLKARLFLTAMYKLCFEDLHESERVRCTVAFLTQNRCVSFPSTRSGPLGC